MNETMAKHASRDIVVDEVFAHSAETIWKALTDGSLIARWLMPAEGFEAVPGKDFTFRTRPAGAWDGTIRCRVLDVKPARRLSYSWQGGDEGNVGYGSRLDTVVTWVLSPLAEGTRVQLIHSGFLTPKNDTAFENMNRGWQTILPRLNSVVDEQD